MKRKYSFHSLFCLVILMAFFSSCSDDDKKADKLPGLWMLQKVTENDQEMTLSAFDSNLKMLVESNGAYRTYTTDGVTSKSHFGTWSVDGDDDQWLALSVDVWQIQKNPLEIQNLAQRWHSNHILDRFTILTLNDSEMTIRLKMSVGKKKYSALFVGETRPDITEASFDEIDQEFKVDKTYIYTFKKEQ